MLWTVPVLQQQILATNLICVKQTEPQSDCISNRVKLAYGAVPGFVSRVAVLFLNI